MNAVRDAAAAATALLLFASACSAQSRSTPTSAPAAPRAAGALPQLRDLGSGVWIGGQPEGDAGFAELRRMGVRTLISVDGAPPDVERARRFGLRYVHLPIRYSEIEPRRQLELARAVDALPGPVFVHCHLGKHRGPAAAASALASLGRVTPTEAEAILRAAGTSQKYQGLYATVRNARRLSDAELAAASTSFPEVERLSGVRAGMSRLDQLATDLEHLRSSDWLPGVEHADLTPDRTLTDATALLVELKELSRDREADFIVELERSADDLKAVRTALGGSRNVSAANQAFDRFLVRCIACHDRFRE